MGCACLLAFLCSEVAAFQDGAHEAEAIEDAAGVLHRVAGEDELLCHGVVSGA